MRDEARPCVAVSLFVAALPGFGATLSATVRDAAGNPVADAVIYAMPTTDIAPPAKVPRHASVEQIEREFVPYVTPVQVGTTVNFPNRDPLLHHVYSFSAVKNFEIKLYSGESPQGILFEKPGIVTLGCNIHDWMIGYIYIVETPRFAKSHEKGQARIAGLGRRPVRNRGLAAEAARGRRSKTNKDGRSYQCRRGICIGPRTAKTQIQTAAGFHAL